MDGVRLGCVPGGSGRPAGGVKKGDHMISSMASPRKIQAVLIDLSGTLHVEDAAVGGSVGALKKLRSTGVKVKFVTNTTKESKRKLYERLRKIGFDIQPEELFTSLTAALHYVQTHQLRPLLLLEESAKEDFIGISQDKPNAVVIGLAPSCFNYEQMNQAFRLIMGGAQLIAIHKARYVKKADGLSLGPGPCVRVLEYSTDSKAVVLGKPEKKFFLSALQELACEPSNAVMIGDDVRDDVSGAQELGLLGILVKTGKYQAGDESKISPAPHQVVESFPEAVQYIVQHLLL